MYDVLVATNNRSWEAFTYKSSLELIVGDIVEVSFRNSPKLGLIIGLDAAVHPKALDIKIKSDFQLPAELVLSSLELAKSSAMPLSGVAQLLLNSASLAPHKKLKGCSKNKSSAKLPKLTIAQNVALDKLKTKNTSKPQLLHGVTGSGKTRIYLELIAETLKAGKTALILTPEVGLTSQLTDELKKYLEVPVLSWHSALTKVQRTKLWQQIIMSDEPLVITGPRSALFAPIANLGLIVIDEFHDDSYAQTNEPRYRALNMASRLAKQHKARLVCGSATPNVTDYYQFKQAGYQIVDLKEQALPGSHTPTSTIVDMKNEVDKSRLLASASLIRIKKCLDRGEQALVFFNRRGTARLAQCENCGWIHECPNCSHPLNLHKDLGKLLCHSCSYTEEPASTCPDCSSSIVFKSPGIKQLESDLRKDLPTVNIVRFDSDNKKTDSLAAQLGALKEKTNTVIVGTQVITKGLDLPLLSLVVITRAESALSIPDYRSEEKMFQQLAQLSGRVGRGHTKNNQIIVQTYTPDSVAVKSAVKQDWQALYKLELKQRKLAKLPPFATIAIVRVRRKTEAGAFKAAQNIEHKLVLAFPNLIINPPIPALQSKRAGMYEQLIHIFSDHRSDVLKLVRSVNTNEVIELDPINLF